MKSIFINICLAIMVLAMAGCEGYFDINANPNRSTAAEPAFLFSASLTGYSNTRAIELGPSAAAWSQIQGPGTFGVFVNPARYVISVFTNGNSWRTMYTGLQKNLNEAINISRRADIVDNNAISQCKIMRAHAFWYATMIWGDVPFTEAVNPDITQPQFDDQEVVLNGVVSLLDEAIDTIDVTTPQGIGAPNDLIFSGNMDAWVKFAKSLRFRTLMTMVDADPTKASDITEMLSAGGMISSAGDNAIFPFFNEPINQNPIWRILDTYTGRDNICYFASEAIVDPMVELDDPRVDIFFTPGPGAADLEPNPAGSAGSIPNSARVTWSSDAGSPADGIIRPDQPDIIFSYAEQLLLEAEAYYRFAGDAATADAKYREGITASCTYYDVPQADIDAYLATLPELSTLSEQDALRAIAIQQWIEYFERSIEAWVNWRRTEWPELELPINAPTTDIIRRLQYPPDEAGSNTNTPENLPLDEKMWFDK